jgi:uncharacterized membrane protein (UPF0127 family)
MRRSVVPVLLAALAVGACSDDPEVVLLPVTTVTAPPSTSTSPPDGPPASSPATPTTSDAVTPDGFERVRATVTEPDGTVCELCLWLADTGDRRSRGLMFVTDLGDADGMAFVYPALHSGNFWMKNTLLPLSIAFFGVEGTHLAEFAMDPCTEDPCGLYRTPDDFLVAIETTQGGLADLGIGPGSVLEVTDLPCTDPTGSVPTG